MITLHTNFGDIKIALNHEKAPVTAENFLTYCKNGFYDNTIFHRVIDGFMIQGGGMESGMREKATNAQFFINVADNTFLDYRSKEMFGKEVVQEWGYAVFGEVVEGMDVVDKIKGVKTGNKGFHQDVPNEDVVITSVTVD